MIEFDVIPFLKGLPAQIGIDWKRYYWMSLAIFIHL
jgi:hypothetical protein